MRWSLKARLTLWHAVAVTLILVVAALVGDRLLARSVADQVDATLVALAETEAASAVDSPDEPVHLHDFTHEGTAPSGPRLDKFVQVVALDGRIVDRSATLGGARLPVPPELLQRIRRGETVVETRRDFGGEEIRMASVPIRIGGTVQYGVQVGTLRRPVDAFLRATRLLVLGASAAVLAAIILIGAILTRGALSPIESLVAMARRIGESNLAQRLPHPGTDDEIGGLVATLNEMLDRIERSFEVQRRFTADASHELRSPLSRLRAELDIALRRPRAAADYAQVLRSGLDEVERLSALVEQLLTMARLDAGERRATPLAPVALEEVVTEAVRRLEPEARRRAVMVVSDHSPGVSVHMGAQDLALVAGNLLENAVKFSPAGGRVTVRTGADGPDAVLSITDTGPGIPREEIPRVFDRFFRGSASGSPDAAGVGLGLAICRAVVEARGGRIAVESAPGAGATFTVRLPLAA